MMSASAAPMNFMWQCTKPVFHRKTIKKVSTVLKEIVIPHCDELREQSVKDRAKLHVSYIHDGDDFLEMYCTEHGLPYEQTERKI